MYTTLEAKTQGNQFLLILKLLDPAEFVLPEAVYIGSPTGL